MPKLRSCFRKSCACDMRYAHWLRTHQMPLMLRAVGVFFSETLARAMPLEIQACKHPASIDHPAAVLNLAAQMWEPVAAKHALVTIGHQQVEGETFKDSTRGVSSTHAALHQHRLQWTGLKPFIYTVQHTSGIKAIGTAECWRVAVQHLRCFRGGGFADILV